MSTGATQDWEGTRFTVTNLNDYLDMITQIVAIMNGVSFTVFIVMLLITMIGLMNTFRITLSERITEIGTMRAINLQKKQVKQLFIYEGLITATGGTLFGVAAEIIASRILTVADFSGVEKSSLQLIMRHGHLSLPVDPLYIMAVIILITVISLLAIVGPINSALKKSVVDELRTN
jgi:putative ABC transport system permease protein